MSWSWTVTILIYASAYTFISLCIGLVVGRLFRTMEPVLELETPALIEPTLRHGSGDRNGQGEALAGVVLT